LSNSAIVGLLRAILVADTAQFEQGMARASKSSDQFVKDWKGIGRQMSDVGKTLTASITLPLVAVGAAVTKVAMDFESSFANVAKTVDGVSDSAGKLTTKGRELANTMRQIAKEIPATTTELNAIAALGGQMGVPIDQLEHFTRNVAALGVAVDGISTEEAAAGLAQIGNIAGVGTKHIDKYASALVHLGNSSNATEADILEFTKRLMGAGHAVGMSVPQVMALSTAMANVGINAEAGGTAMSTMISKMSMAVSKGGDALKAFDKIVAHTGKNFTELWRESPVQAVDAVVQGLAKAKASGQDLNLVVKDIGASNIRTADTMKRLAGAGTGVADSLKIANEGFSAGNKHLEEATKKYATTENQIKLFWNRLKDVGITLGEALLPALKALVDAVGALTPVLEGMVKAFVSLPTGIQLAAAGLAILAAAVGPLLWALGSLITATTTVVGAFGRQGFASRALTALLGQQTAATNALAAAQARLAGTGGAAGVAGAARAALPLVGMAAIGAGIAISDFHAEVSGRTRDNEIAQFNLPSVKQRVGESHEEYIARLKATREAIDKGKSAGTSGRMSVNILTGEIDTSAPPPVGGGAGGVTGGGSDDDKLSDFEKAVRGMVLAGSGREEADKLKVMAEAIARLGGVSKLSAPFLADLGEEFAGMSVSVDAAGNAWTELGNKLPKALNDARMAAAATGVLNFGSLPREFAAVAEMMAGGASKDLVWGADFINGFRPDQKTNQNFDVQWGRDDIGGFRPEAFFGPASAPPSFGDRFKSSLSGITDALPQVLMSAFTGGGNVGKSIGGLLGGGILGEVGKTVSTKLAGSFLGKGIGSAIGSVIPGIGTLLGGMFGNLLGGLFGPSKVQKAGREATAKIEELQKTLVGPGGLFGSFADLEKSAKSVGLTFEDIWTRKGVDGLKLYQERLAEFDRRQKALAESTSKLGSALTPFGGVMPAGSEGLVQQLLSNPNLSPELRNMLTAAPDWRVAQSMAQDLGIDEGALGGEFFKKKVGDTGLQLVRQIEFFKKLGADISGVLTGMQDEISALVEESQRTGAAIPRTLEPYVRQLAQMGMLLDSNGNQIEVAALTFADIKDEQQQQVISLLEQIRDLLAGKTPGSGGETSPVPSPRGPWGYNDEGVVLPPKPVTDIPMPGFASGTHGQLVNFGSGTPVMLHGWEGVFTRGEAIGANTGGSQMMTVVYQADGRELQRLVFPYMGGETRRLGLAPR
jgi:TP901 family phage tail tape measure protein